MKKVLLVAVMSLGGLTAFAQEETTVVEEATEVVTEKATEAVTEAVTEEATEAVAEEAPEVVADEAMEVVPEVVADEAMEVAPEAASEEATEAVADEAMEVAPDVVAEEAVEAQDGFNELALEEVPEAITAALEAAHPGATIAKAYMNEDAQYKLEVAKEDGETAELYADAEGNWIEM